MDGARRRDPLGLIGVICGIAAIVTLPLTLVPLLGCLCLPVGPLGSLTAVVLGGVSAFRTGDDKPYDGRLTAAAAALLGVTWWLLIAGLYLFVGDDLAKSYADLRSARPHGP